MHSFISVHWYGQVPFIRKIMVLRAVLLLTQNILYILYQTSSTKLQNKITVMIMTTAYPYLQQSYNFFK